MLTRPILHSNKLANRNSIVRDQYRWPKTIPYYIEESVGEMMLSNGTSKASEYWNIESACTKWTVCVCVCVCVSADMCPGTFLSMGAVEMNAKGVILKAFEQYRLKTCIDFTPWKGEDNHISVFKGSGWQQICTLCTSILLYTFIYMTGLRLASKFNTGMIMI